MSAIRSAASPFLLLACAALSAGLLLGSAACTVIPPPLPDPIDELPAEITANNVSLMLAEGVHQQDLVVRGNNFTVEGVRGAACGDDAGWTVIEGDVVILGNNAVFRNILIRGNVEVRGNNADFVDSCVNGVPAQLKTPVFGGDAALVTGQVLGVPVELVDTGDLPEVGGALDASVLEINVDDALRIEALHASVIGKHMITRAEALMSNIEIIAGEQEISVRLVAASASAECVDGEPVVDGGFEIDDLLVNGEEFTVTTEANQVFSIVNDNDDEVGRITVNEQISTVDGRFGEFEVNGLHVEIFGSVDLVFGHARASIECPDGITEPGPKGDFVTGGGFIETADAFANFGVAGGVRENGDLFGHLVYIDHGTDMKIRGTGVTAYETVNETTRRIEGACEVNEVGGFTFVVELADNGEPGVDDTFSISVSNGYQASGTLIGGNIQIHEEVEPAME